MCLLRLRFCEDASKFDVFFDSLAPLDVLRQQFLKNLEGKRADLQILLETPIATSVCRQGLQCFWTELKGIVLSLLFASS